MSKRAAASLAEIVVRSAVTGWIAALYGALYIYAKADFATTGSLWIFGWPFCVLLALATLVHLWLVGGCGRRLPSPIRWVNVVNRVLASAEETEVAPAALQTALIRLPAFPAIDACWAFMVAGSVVVAMATLERWVGGNTHNVEAVLVGGLIATVLYGAMSFTVTETLVSRPCRRLRSAAARAGLDPYVGPTLATPVRIVTLAAPTVLALVVAPPLVAARGVGSAGLAHALIVVLGTALCVGLAWLHAAAIREAAADLGHAAQRLVGNETARFITGTIDAELVGMARAFNQAASHVDRSLQISAARYSALFEGAGDAILLIEPATGRILEANRRALELTGLDEAALKAGQFESLFAVETPLEDVRRLPAGTHRWRAGMRVERVDGSECPVDVALSTVAVGEHTVLQAILHDVSARERIESELRKSVQRLEGLYHLAVTLGGTVEQVAEHIAVTLPALLEVPVVAVVLYDRDEQVVLALYEDGTVTRGMRSALVGTPAARLRAERRPCVVADAARVLPGRRVPGRARDRELRRHSRPRTRRRGRRTGGGDGRARATAPRSGHAAAVDVRRPTGARPPRGRVRARARGLHRARDGAESRAPRGTRSVDRGRPPEERVHGHDVPRAAHAAQHLHWLHGVDAGRGPGLRRDAGRRATRRARTHARRRPHAHPPGRGHVERAAARRCRRARFLEPVSLRDLFAELQGAERLLRASSAVREQWIVDDGVPLLTSDRLKLRQILTNLVGNARKFTSDGTITVRARCLDATRIAISVADTGCGIAAADVPHVFELYRQAANGLTHDGCGIGLYIVRRYCELLGGRVDVDSAVGLGTCFTLTLPVRADEALTPYARPAA